MSKNKPSERQARPYSHDEKEAFRKAQEEAEKKRKDAYEKLENQMAEVANTTSGAAVLAAIMNECGFHMPTLVVNPANPAEIMPEMTIANEAKRTVWLKIRKLIPHTFLVRIENPEPKSDVAKAMEKL